MLRMESSGNKILNNKIGDLVYAPSEVVLYKRSEKSSEVQDWTKLEKPTNLLITDVAGKLYEVFYENEYWLVNKKQVYKI